MVSVTHCNFKAARRRASRLGFYEVTLPRPILDSTTRMSFRVRIFWRFVQSIYQYFSRISLRMPTFWASVKKLWDDWSKRLCQNEEIDHWRTRFWISDKLFRFETRVRQRWSGSNIESTITAKFCTFWTVVKLMGGIGLSQIYEFSLGPNLLYTYSRALLDRLGVRVWVSKRKARLTGAFKYSYLLTTFILHNKKSIKENLDVIILVL